MYSVTLEQGDYDSAKQAILKAINLNPQVPDLWNKYIGLTLERLNGAPSEIEGLYKEALLKTKNNPDILVQYGQFLEKQGKIKEAIIQWQEALKQQPNNTDYQKEVKRLQAIKN